MARARAGRLSRAAIIIAGVLATTGPVLAETVIVKYRGPVDTKAFACTDTARSSFVRHVCYDQPNAYMLIDLRGTWYHYCGIDAKTVAALIGAPSIGRFFNASVRGRFDCRTGRVPAYR